VDPEQYWHMTPRQTIQAMKAYRQREEHAAWLFGLYTRSAHYAEVYPDMPKGQPEPVKPMSEDAMKAVMRGISKRKG
jgi:hypothetical protein